MKSPKTLCIAPGCNAYAANKGRCIAHQRDKVQDLKQSDARRMSNTETAKAARFRSGPKWQSLRSLHRVLNPLCCDPFNRHNQTPALSDHSHHIKSLQDAPELGLVMSNLAPLCARCHAKIEGMEKRGVSTKELFSGWRNIDPRYTF